MDYETSIFFKICISSGVVLPSLDNGRIDLDLVLLQQQRRLYTQTQKISINYDYFMNNDYNKLSKEIKIQLWEKRKDERTRLINKFNWLWNKQRIRRKNSQVTYQYHNNYKNKNSNKLKLKNKKDGQRYKNRKKFKLAKELEESLKQTVLNKSDYNFEIKDIMILNMGLNYATTPNWSENMARNEWEQFYNHVRRVEWTNYFNNNNTEDNKENLTIPKKLKIPKYNRPNKASLDDNNIAYTEMIKNKMRNLEKLVRDNYKKKNNTTMELKTSLQKLLELVKSKKIVICKGDKDGKILIINYNDYIKIIETNLLKYKEVIGTEEMIIKTMKNKKMIAETLVENIYNNNDIDENLLYHSIGKKVYNFGLIKRTTGPHAKYFNNMNFGYVYPLFKTHKYQEKELEHRSIENIQIRLVQSAGDTFLSKKTSFQEYVLKPISVDYCKTTINEYCRDSKNYLEDLMKWKYESKDNENENYKIVAVDVKALYPNIPKTLVKLAVNDALIKCSNFSNSTKINLTKLVMFCLDNIIIKFQNKFYTQENGIVTGENNSVSIANLSLHYIIKELPMLNVKTVIFKRFIDDIIYITVDNPESDDIKTSLIDEFQKHNLELTFREMNTKIINDNVEFLDVLHYSQKNAKKGFITKNYIKPTAVNRKFLNGKSFHPTYIYKGIIFGEAKRLRRLNEFDQNYLESLTTLKSKCIKSNFKQDVIDNCFNIIKDYTNQWTSQNNCTLFQATNKQRKKNDRIQTWPTSFKSMLNLNEKESNLKPLACITYRRPPTIGNTLLNYKKIAHENNRIKDKKFGSKQCGKCGMCGNFGKLKNMVLDTDSIKTKYGKSLKIKQSLSCKNYGIYAGKCKICNELYIGQTATKFCIIWTGHQSVWKETIRSGGEIEQGDEKALILHYMKCHKDMLNTKGNFTIAEAYDVIFLEEPPMNKLDVAEDFWMAKTGSTINIKRTFLPRVK